MKKVFLLKKKEFWFYSIITKYLLSYFNHKINIRQIAFQQDYLESHIENKLSNRIPEAKIKIKIQVFKLLHYFRACNLLLTGQMKKEWMQS